MEKTKVRVNNPFPGLRSFKPDEAHLFFGREGQTDALLLRLKQAQFLTVVGTSGSGKSSLVKAGLLPSLYSGSMTQVGSSWRIASFRPGDNPISRLAEALSQPEVLGVGEDNPTMHRLFLETTLRRSALGLIQVKQQSNLQPDENLLIIVDQFEEIFRFKQSHAQHDSADEAAAFVKLLLETTRHKTLRIYVVLTMRSDFLGDCAQFRDLPEAINDGQYLIPRMTRDQRRLAIEGPIAVAGGKISSLLVDRLLNDMGDNPDQLPVLQHALMRTWDNWTGDHQPEEPIDLRHYEAIGTMENALSRHAAKIYDSLADDRSKFITEKLFKCLTEKGGDNRGIRRPIQLGRVCAIAEATLEEVIPVIEEFRQPGRSFLMPPVPVELEPETTLDISHESLMRYWEKLKVWVEEEGESARIYRRIAETAILHQKDEENFLRNPALRKALEWREQTKPTQAWADLYNPEFELAKTFLEDSEKAEENAELEERKVDIESSSSIQQSFSYLPDVYISYSRQDKEFVKKLVEALKQYDIKVWIDWENIPVGSDWREEIKTAIKQAHTLVFVVSPDSIASQYCRQDIDYATEINTRIVPVLWRDDRNLQQAPEEIRVYIRVYNWLDMHKLEDFNHGIKNLVDTINTDSSYLRMHSRLSTQALEWESHNRSKVYLLTTKQVQEAKRWLRKGATKTPPPSILQREYITASRQAALKEEKRLTYERQLVKEFEECFESLDLKPVQEEFLKSRWLNQVLWTERRASIYRERYTRLRLISIIGGIVAPVLVTLNVVVNTKFHEAIKYSAIGLSSSVAVALATEEFFGYGRRWHSYRRVAESLKSQGWQFFVLAGFYIDFQDHQEAFSTFAEQVESIIEYDVDKYITQQTE